MSYEELEHLLQARNISPTAMRIRVLGYLREQPNAVSLTDVEKGLQHTDRVTVYRTLKTFEEHHLIHSIEDGTGAAKYALCRSECLPLEKHTDLHIHFYCRSCAETSCLPQSAVPALSLPEGYTREEVSLTVKGICPKCNS